MVYCHQDLKLRFKVGDKVRISKYKRKVFDKGYTPYWTEGIFLVDKIQSTNPITYRLKDLNNEEIQGSFYDPELLKAKQDVFRKQALVSSILGSKISPVSGFPLSSVWVPSQKVGSLY